MPYSYLTLATALTDLGQRLSDAGSVFWTTAEKTAYIQEALRTWGALTAFWRGDFTFQTNSATEWYDIPSLTNSLRPYTLTDDWLYSMAEYHLLEPQTTTYPLAWTGSKQFALTDLMGAAQRRLDETLGVTGCTITASLVTALPGRTFLPDAVIDIRRVAFASGAQPNLGYGGGGYGQGPYGGQAGAWFGAYALWEEDLWSKQSYAAGYRQNAASPTPRTWLRSTEPPLSFDVFDPVGVPGAYDLLTINGSTTFTTASATPLGIPDDWAWVVKWGMLADLLSRESLAKDEPRADYANRRYRQGLALMTDAPALLGMQVNGVVMPVDPVRLLDEYNPLWQGGTTGAPQRAVTAGLNLFTFAPVTDPTVYGGLATVVQNAPVPVLTTDAIQLPRDVYDVVLDYAQHLAAFKQGGAEFEATMPLLDRFMAEAALYNSRIADMAQYERTLTVQSVRESEANPRYEPQRSPETLNG